MHFARKFRVRRLSDIPENKVRSTPCRLISHTPLPQMGVHLDEPTSPASDRWSGHLTSPVKTQWTDEELDAFVRQLSNPQHHVTKIAAMPQAEASTSSPRKCSLDLCHELKDRGRVRAPLARSETDTSVSFGDLDIPVSERGMASNVEEDGSKSGGRGIISGLSGLRLIKNKKLARSSHAAKRYTAHKSKDDQVDPDSLGDPSPRDKALGSVTFSCSSPEGSDGELAAEMRTSEQLSNGANKDGGKKRRFRKMLSRPLNRSQSAGCAKDVPAHALFLENQQKKSKDTETLAARKSRASEGDIRRLDDADDNEVEEDANSATTAVRSKRISVSRIHKTKSADSAMLATDEFGAILPQSKGKSRNIAKKISRKMNFLRRRHTDSTLGLMKNDEGARRLANVDPEEALEWSKSFETLLFDKTGLELFRGFLISEHSDENIEFWIACENYKNMKSSKHLPSLATKIFNDYVAVQSKKEINLDSKTRSLTFESVTSNPNRQTFDEAQRRVQALMEKDSYRRFLESEIYQDLAAGNIQHKA
ncbi:regulator of G-protein signaling 3-like isoform X2 [Biomphalaria glabrata]|uniref:Regulator of G-protein signaling 3-like isoform X2 n=1 Tax=Biomphalaria glabrata TaxID=6526 RepID=A0A9W3BGF4_BIOGL|nr:regulator of G-protein signaling 3-like isoform X2 [Biomphalaria glabrata]